jgi:CRP-like cAMP-binding protein
MSFASLDQAAMFDRALDFATRNQTIVKLLTEIGIDPANITYNAIFDRLQDLAVANVTFANILALAGGIFLLMTFVVRTIALMRVLCIFSIIFFLGSAALAYSVPKFLMYLLALPINVIRLVQIRNVVKRARVATQGALSMDWLKPFMTPRTYLKGEVLFRKGDPGTEMFQTVSGKFLVTEIGIEISAGRMLGELGFISPDNKRTQSVECIETGDVLTISYDRLLEIYFENPEFGYFFLRLVSDRLLQNHARLERLLEEDKAKLQALIAPAEAKPEDPKPAVAKLASAASAPMRALREAAGRRSQAKQQAVAAQQQIELVKRRRENWLKRRYKKFMRKIAGLFIYWLGWLMAILVLVQAVILAVLTGNPLIPLGLGTTGVTLWLLALSFRYMLARS